MFQLRHALVAVLEQVGRQAHRRLRRVDVVAARDVLLEHVVLRRAAQLLARHALLLADQLVQQQQARRRRVDRHRRRHLVERDAVERRAHVVDRVDRHARAPDLAQAARVVGVQAQLRRQVERHRQPRRALREQVAVALVRLLRRRVARVLAHRPRLLAVHLAVHAARVRELARLAQVEALAAGPPRVYSSAISMPESVKRRGSSGPTIGATVRCSSVDAISQMIGPHGDGPSSGVDRTAMEPSAGAPACGRAVRRATAGAAAPGRREPDSSTRVSSAHVHLPGHRRRRLPRLAPVRRAARARQPRDLRRQPRDGLAREHRAHPRPGQRFMHVGIDIIEPYFVEEPVDFVYHLASPASPIDYLRLPLHTLKVGSYGTHHTLGLAKAKRARFLIAVDQRGLRRPARTPAVRELLGARQPDRPARRLRRGQALRRGADDGLPPPAGRRHGDRADLQHVRRSDAPPRRPRDPDVPAPGARQPPDHGVRRRQPDALLLLRLRPDPRHHRARRVRPPQPREHRQPRRVHAAGTRGDHQRARPARPPRSSTRRCPRTTPSSASPTSRSRASCSAGRRRCRCATACSARSSSPASSCSSAATLDACAAQRCSGIEPLHLRGCGVVSSEMGPRRVGNVRSVRSAAASARASADRRDRVTHASRVERSERDIRRKRPPALSFLLRMSTLAASRGCCRCWRSTSPAWRWRSSRRSCSRKRSTAACRRCTRAKRPNTSCRSPTC